MKWLKGTLHRRKGTKVQWMVRSTLRRMMSEKNQSSNARKKNGERVQEPALRCPRCDSPNTKFCYYNNYSLSQPRHFCKTCRRYWTKGGALRNVPIGGGCQKSKKVKSSSSSSTDGLRFFQVLSPSAMEFQLNFQRLSSQNQGFYCHGNVTNQAFTTNPSLSLDQHCEGTSSSLMGLGNPFSSSGANPNGFLDMGSYRNFEQNNQELLQWKLQQQRLSMLVTGDLDKEIPSIVEQAKLQPIFMQQVTTGSKKDNSNPSTEWFFEHSCTPTMASTHAASNTTNATETTNWSGTEGSFGLISGI